MMVREIRKFISVRKIMFPVGIVHGNLGFTSGKKSSYFLNFRAINVLIYRPTHDYTKCVDFNSFSTFQKAITL